MTTSRHPAENDQPAPDIARFFCLHCGYDLTGHSGERRRCPECGNTTWIEELKLALAIQKKGIGAGESPVLPCLLFLPTVFFGLPGLLAEGFDWFRFMFLGLFVVSAAAWCWSLRMYFRRYASHYDRLAFLGASHLVAVQIVLGVVVLGAMGLTMVLTLIRSGFDATMLIVALASAVLVASSIWPYRYMKRRLPAYKLPKPPETNENE